MDDYNSMLLEKEKGYGDNKNISGCHGFGGRRKDKYAEHRECLGQ